MNHSAGNSQSRFRELMKFNKRQGDPRRVVSRAEVRGDRRSLSVSVSLSLDSYTSETFSARGVGLCWLLQLAKHCSRESCWVALEGAVFDVTYYLHFHPGGERVLLREAGRDATAAFRRHHPWVNFRHILEHCQVGVLGTEEAEVDEAVVAAAGPSFSSPTAAGARGGEALTPTAVIALPLPPAIPEEGEDAEAEAAITPSFGTAPSLC